SHTDVGKIVSFLRSLQVSPSLRLVDRPTTGNVAKGLGLFTEHCATCHSTDREQATAPHLEHPAFQELATNGYLEHSIRFGRPGTPMEPWGDRLADEEIDDLIAAVRSFGATQGRGPGAPPQGNRGNQGNQGNHDAHHNHAHAWENHPGDDDDRPNPVLDVWAQIGADELVLGQDNQAPAFSLRGRWYVSAEQLGRALTRRQKMILLDARAMSDWLTGHLPGALPVPFYADSDTFDRIPDDDTWVVIYCGCPHAAADRVATRLRARGIDHIAVLDEGYFHWRDNDYPVVTGPARGELGAARRELRVDLPAP
ncbi:MAG: c-type cytochrome, partial [Deltaproteobacteria bacterium]|nr:c-type cytochrome [Deltaproteobacteria bacterium]